MPKPRRDRKQKKAPRPAARPSSGAPDRRAPKAEGDAGSVPFARASDPESKKSAFALHGRIGGWLAIPLAFVMLTGALAVYGRELDAMMFPAAACAGAQRGHIDVPWSTLAHAAEHAVPDSRVLTLSAPEGDGESAWALVQLGPGDYRHVYLDPHDGHARGIAPYRTPRRFLRDLHRDWLLGENVGLVLVTSLVFALALSLYTGLSFWSRRGGDTAARRYHRLASMAVAPFLLVVIVTATWYWGENLAGLFDIRPSGETPHIAPEYVERLRAHEPIGDLDLLVRHAQDVFPELEIHLVSLPTARRSVLTVAGHADEGPLVRELANQVFVHPFTGDVIAMRRARDLGPVQWWEHAVDAIHFGTWGGGATRALWMIFGLAAALLPVTGLITRRRRLRSKAG